MDHDQIRGFVPAAWRVRSSHAFQGHPRILSGTWTATVSRYSILDGELERPAPMQLVNVRYQGVDLVTRLVPSEHDAEVAALLVLADARPPQAVEPPRRGLLWHVLDASRRWFRDGL